jgi:hypothetical protein
MLTPLKHLISNVLVCPFSDLYFLQDIRDWLLFLNYSVCHVLHVQHFQIQQAKKDYERFKLDHAKQIRQMKRLQEDRLINWLFAVYVPLKNFSLTWRRHHCRSRAAKFRPMLDAQGLQAGRDLYRVTPTMTRDLGFSGVNRRTAPFSQMKHLQEDREEMYTFFRKSNLEIVRLHNEIPVSTEVHALCFSSR